MQLLWIKYQTKRKLQKPDPKLNRATKWLGVKHAYDLFLHLGDSDGKSHLIKTSVLTPAEVNNLRRSLQRLKAFSLKRKVEWIRDNLPHAYKKAYRTIPTNVINVMKRYDPKPLE